MSHIKTDKNKLRKAFCLYFKYLLNKSNNKFFLYTILLFNMNAHRYLRYYKLVLKTIKIHFYKYLLFKDDTNLKMC